MYYEADLDLVGVRSAGIVSKQHNLEEREEIANSTLSDRFECKDLKVSLILFLCYFILFWGRGGGGGTLHFCICHSDLACRF